MKYTALTIGPIYKTFKQGQRTRMIWGASYLFSFMLRELVKILKYGAFFGGECKDCKIEGKFLIPSTEEINEKSKYGAGKYPDRFIFQSEEGDFEKVQLAINKLFEFLAEEIEKHISGKGQYSTKDIKEFLEKYFQFYYVEKEIPEGENIVLSLYNLLDSLELKNKFISEIKDENYLQKYLFKVNVKKNNNYSFLTKDAFSDEEQKKRYKSSKRFDSLIEISTRGLARIDTEAETEYKKLIKAYIEAPQIEDKRGKFDEIKVIDDNQNKFISELKDKFKDEYKKYHNYVAILYADGDNMGATLKKIGSEPEQLIDFSQKLLSFNKGAEEKIFDYGGSPIYIGGDDILAFVPVACLENKNKSDKNKKLKTIFDLITELDNEFNKVFTKKYADELDVTKPTLSFGVSIAYFKFPLYENMLIAYDLLKKAKNGTKNKNAIVLKLQEHSGNIFEIDIEKENKGSYKLIKNLISDLTEKISLNNNNFNKKWINSVIHKFNNATFQVLLKSALSRINNDELLENLFNNSFRDNIHKEGNGKKFLEKLSKLTFQLTLDKPDDLDKNIITIYSVLRFIDFLNKKHTE